MSDPSILTAMPFRPRGFSDDPDNLGRTEDATKTHACVYTRLQWASCRLWPDSAGFLLHLLVDGPVHPFSGPDLQRGSQENDSDADNNIRLRRKRRAHKEKDENRWFIFSANTQECVHGGQPESLLVNEKWIEKGGTQSVGWGRIMKIKVEQKETKRTGGGGAQREGKDGR